MHAFPAAASAQLEVPSVILGYSQDSGRPASLHVYITLKPRLAPPAAVSEERVCGEQEDVARHARK
jgi:coiled-coil and C2 domain-containing protein 2A